MFHRFKGSYLSYIFIYFFFFFCMAAFSSVLSVYLTGIGIGVVPMARIVSASGIFAFATVPLTGYICDRTGKPRLICGIMMTAVGIFALLFALTRRVWLLFLLNGLTMSFIGAVQPTCERLAGASRFRYGILRVWGTVGYAVGAQFAGFTIQNLPAIVLFAAILAAGLLTAAGFAGAEDPTDQAKEKTARAPLSSFLSNRYYLLFLMITVFFWGCSGANMTYVPILLRELGLDTSRIGTVIFFSTLVEIPLILFSNRFMDRFNGKSLILFACTLTLIEFLVYGLISSAWVVTATVVLLKAIATTTYVMIQLKIVRNLVAPELTTTALSLAATCSSVGTIVLQNIGGILTDRFRVQTFYLMMAGLILLTMALAALLKVGNDEKVFS